MKVVEKFNVFVGAIAVALLLGGCISRSGSIVGVKNDHQLEVIVDEDFVKVGDSVGIYRTECNSPGYSKLRRCNDFRLGQGKIVSRAGNQAVVQADPKVDVKASSFVQWAYPK